MPSTLQRRSFLASLAACGLVLAGPARRRASAGTSGPRRLVLVFANGGLDTSYSIDPKGGTDIDVPSGTEEVVQGIPLWTDPTRPNTRAFFEAHGARTCVVNGIAVRSISHPECTRRMLTGRPGSGNPDIGAIVGHTLGAELPMGYLILGTSGFSGPLAASTGRVGQTNQIVALLDDDQGYPPMAGDDTPAFVPSSAENDRIREFVLAGVDRERAVRAAAGFNRARIDDFEASLGRGDDLRARADDFGKAGLSRTFDQQIEIAVQMLSAGVAWSVNIDPGVALDTHDLNEQQGPQQEVLFAGITELLAALAATESESGASLLDETVVVVMSEMSRTPKLNAALGKDHWPVASAMVIGAGVAGGRAVGGTSDLGDALTVDLESGETTEGGVTLGPANFAAGILELVGADAQSFFPDVEALHALRS